MTLEEYAAKHNNYIDIDVSDSVYDVLANYTYDFLEEPKDSYDKLMTLLGQNIKISNNLDDKQLVCNFYDFFENHKEALKDEFFSKNFSEKLTLDLDNILSGNCSDSFYDKLYSCFTRNLNNEKGYDL